jgi:hypothetical protein
MVLTIDENFVRTQNFWIPKMLGPGEPLIVTFCIKHVFV